MISNISAPLITSTILTCINDILKIHTTPSDNVVSLTRDLILEVPVFYSMPVGDRRVRTYPFPAHMYIANLDIINYRETLAILKEQYQLNARAKFIIITKNLSREVIDIFSEYLISDVIFVNPLSGSINTYNPFGKKTFYDIDMEISTLGNCVASLENAFAKLPLFDKKIPDQWNGCPVKICMIYEPPYTMCSDCKHPGISIEIFNFVSKMMNMTPKWIVRENPKEGDFNQYFYDSLYTNERCDLHVGLTLDLLYDVTYCYLFDDLYFFVPTPKLLPRWRYVLKALTVEIWICWIVTIVILSSLWLIFRKIQGERNTAVKAVEVFWTNIDYFVEQYPELTAKTLSMKIIFLLMFCSSFFMNMIFKCNFNYILTGINFEDPIESVSDMIKRNMFFGYLYDEFYILWLNDETSGNYINSHSKICDFSYKCFNQTAFDRNFVSMQILRFYKYIQDLYVDDDGLPLIRLIHPPVISFGVVGLLPLGHPITVTVNRILLDLDAYGFIDFVLSKYDNNIVMEPPSHFSEMKLSLEHIVAPSVIWFSGFLLGFVIFLMEVYHYI
ncbi:hypothetical protein WA026_006179 [Henosepilachna vigintioctopunctata]|uniref:Ionotropic receptor n=1 Tax=Henosepilachna vigintioctopunctata TaxID=420089 RepID=A0AAW1TP28_9CUCU